MHSTNALRRNNDESETKLKANNSWKWKHICDMLSAPESTSFTWQLSIKTVPEKPRFITVGFHIDKDGNQTKIPFTFEYVYLKNAYVTLNSDLYPVVDYNLTFSNQKFSRVYGDPSLFGIKLFGMDELITQSNITPSNYKKFYPFFTFYVSKRKEKLKSSSVDIQLKANFTKSVPANTSAFALVISDKILSFQSDGNEMSVVY